MMGAGFLAVQEAGGPRSEGGKAGFAKVPSLVYTLLCPQVVEGAKTAMLLLSSREMERSGPTLLTSVILNHPFKGPTSKHSHVGS